jgi:hypothetical protein
MAPLSTLRAKLARRKKARNRQARLWRKTKKAGHGKAAKRHTKAVRKLRRLIEKAKDARRRKSGRGPWGGTQSIVELEVIPVGQKYGAPVTSLKRAASHPLTIANPSSDHSALATEAYAVDFGTHDGAPIGYAVASALGIRGWTPGSYTGYYIERAGKIFRVQILWAVPGHYDHLHVGVRRA